MIYAIECSAQIKRYLKEGVQTVHRYHSEYKETDYKPYLDCVFNRGMTRAVLTIFTKGEINQLNFRMSNTSD